MDAGKAAGDAIGLATGDPVKVTKYGCMAGACSFLLLFGIMGFLFVIFLNGGAGADKPDAVASASCGEKMELKAVPTTSECGGVANTKKVISSNNFYKITSFGCNEGFPKDSGDNCIPGCIDKLSKKATIVTEIGATPKQVTLPDSGRAYEEKIIWYSANSAQYGCGNHLKVTNPKTGKAVVVRVIDAGPGCSVQGDGLRFDVSQATAKALGDLGFPSPIVVEKVDKSTTLGPVDACDSASLGQELACKAGVFKSIEEIKNIKSTL